MFTQMYKCVFCVYAYVWWDSKDKFIIGFLVSKEKKNDNEKMGI